MFYILTVWQTLNLERCLRCSWSEGTDDIGGDMHRDRHIYMHWTAWTLQDTINSA